jgi:PAS domain S-box-containing protein
MIDQHPDPYTPPPFDPASLLERIRDGVAVLDRDGRFVYLNETGARIVRQPKAALLGKVIWEIYPDDGASLFAENYRAACETQQPSTFEEYYPPFDMWFAMTIYPTDGGVTIYFEDITDRHVAMGAMQEFIAMMAHELRNPLTSIAGYAQMMQKREQYDAKALATILTQITRLDRLAQDLHDSARLNGKAPELVIVPVDVAALVTTTVEQAQATTANHTLQVEMAARLPPALWDADRIIQALRNILSNAIKYTPAGGVIYVRVQDMGDTAQIAVTDQGIGIPDEAMRRLFTPFYRAENAQVAARGMGLGLAVSKGFVEAHGGQIGVASVIGAGSTFTLILPYREG